jgi:hypothetical protein
MYPTSGVLIPRNGIDRNGCGGGSESPPCAAKGSQANLLPNLGILCLRDPHRGCVRTDPSSAKPLNNILGMLVPYTDPQLLQSTGNAASSPFVLAMTRVGIKGLPCEHYFSSKHFPTQASHSRNKCCRPYFRVLCHELVIILFFVSTLRAGFVWSSASHICQNHKIKLVHVEYTRDRRLIELPTGRSANYGVGIHVCLDPAGVHGVI